MGSEVKHPEFDEALLWQRLQRAKRIVFNPLKEMFQSDPVLDGACRSALVLQLVQLEQPSKESLIWHKGLAGLQTRLYSLMSNSSRFDMEAIRGTFPPHEDKEWDHDPRFCAAGLLYYLAHEFLGDLYAKGKIVCVAEDVGQFTLVPYGELFSTYSDELKPPYENDFWMPSECDAEDLKQSGADRLWYAFSRDFKLSDQRTSDSAENASRRGPLNNRHHGNESNAARALKDVEQSANARPAKSDVLDVLKDFVGSRKGAERAWDKAELSDWSRPGVPPAGQRMSKDQFRTAFEAVFDN